MVLTPRGALAFLRSDNGRKWIRYSTVSAIAVAISEILIVVFSSGMKMSGVYANVLSVGLSAIPSYYLNRAWVWGKRGKNHIAKEVIPFWVFTFAGLLLSTLIVWLIVPHPIPADADWTYTARVMIGQLLGFGILWIAKFFAFEKLLFGASTHRVEGDTEPVPADRT